MERANALAVCRTAQANQLTTMTTNICRWPWQDHGIGPCGAPIPPGSKIEACEAHKLDAIDVENVCPCAECRKEREDDPELPRCVYPVDGKPCGVYAPEGKEYCQEHLTNCFWETVVGCCSPEHPCWED